MCMPNIDSAVSEIMPIFQGIRVVVCNDTFNNISVISCQSILLVEETGLPGENHRSDKCYDNVVSSTPPHERDSKSQRL